VPWLRRLVAGLTPRRLGLDPGSVHVGFVLDKVALGQVFPRVLRFSSISFIPPVLHYSETLIIFITGLHNKPQGCGASVASAAGLLKIRLLWCFVFVCVYIYIYFFKFSYHNAFQKAILRGANVTATWSSRHRHASIIACRKLKVTKFSSATMFHHVSLKFCEPNNFVVIEGRVAGADYINVPFFKN
jgi:hypothetical protein